MSFAEVWYKQDILKLTVHDWISLLNRNNIFDERAKELVLYVYHQPYHQSTATDIGKGLNNVPQQTITALNRQISQRIYLFYGKEAPPNSEGGKRYWNVLFDGVIENPLDENSHFIWRLRSNLIAAIENVYQIK